MQGGWEGQEGPPGRRPREAGSYPPRSDQDILPKGVFKLQGVRHRTFGGCGGRDDLSLFQEQGRSPHFAVRGEDGRGRRGCQSASRRGRRCSLAPPDLHRESHGSSPPGSGADRSPPGGTAPEQQVHEGLRSREIPRVSRRDQRDSRSGEKGGDVSAGPERDGGPAGGVRRPRRDGARLRAVPQTEIRSCRSRVRNLPHLRGRVMHESEGQGGQDMIGFDLTKEQIALQDMARKFAANEIRPKAVEYDHASKFPEDIFEKAYALGLMSGFIPEEYGGLGLSAMDTCIIEEELGWGCSGIATSLTSNGLALTPILIAGADGQKMRVGSPFAGEPHHTSL